MNSGEQIVRKLDECIQIMKLGVFTKYELEFIIVGLKKMLEKTEGVLNKKHIEDVEP